MFFKLNFFEKLAFLGKIEMEKQSFLGQYEGQPECLMRSFCQKAWLKSWQSEPEGGKGGSTEAHPLGQAYDFSPHGWGW